MNEPDYEQLLGSYDMFDVDQERQKWELFSYARSKCPVAHTDADGGGQYLVTRYDDVRRVLEDPVTFSSSGVAPRPSPVLLHPLDADPPLQPALRKILNPLFSRTFLLRFEPQMRASAASLVTSWLDVGEVEFVGDFAAPFVAQSLATIVFNEQDPTRMSRASEIVSRVAVESSDENFFDLAVLAGEYLAEREENPVDREDVLQCITTGEVNGRPLTEDERLGVLTVLFLGGLDTTRGAIAAIAYHLARDPGLEARVRDPKWIRQDMDEFIRLESPVGCLGRRVMADVELAGVSLHKGDQLLVRFDSANRDEAKFDDPDELRFDVGRAGHAGFGLGIHRCLGQHLARIQITIAFEELLARVTNLRYADPSGEIHWAPGIANGPERLKLAFDRL